MLHTGAVSGFQFPEGVEFFGDDGTGNVSFTVSIPVDDDGFLGRECPDCQQHFRVAHEEYDRLPDDVRLWCVYCGHRDDHSEFMSGQQKTRLMAAAGGYAEQLVGKIFDDVFGDLARGSRGSMIHFSYRSRPFYPTPLPDIDEERLVRERTCGTCHLRYAVFGEHRFCPACGPLPPLTTALDALDAETKRLQALVDLPEPLRAKLRESGVLHRTYVDTIENVVGIVEVLSDRVFRAAVPNADAMLKGKGKVFQRLDDLADLFRERLGVDVRASLGTRWPALVRAWATRHVLTHCDGVVDGRYLASVPTSSARIGQRLQIRQDDASAAIADADGLCRAIVSGSL
jgi:hypothetical protein